MKTACRIAGKGAMQRMRFDCTNVCHRTSHVLSLSWLLVQLLCWSNPLRGQGVESAPTSFEVASIRMVQPYSAEELQAGASNDPIDSFPSHRFVARHVPLPFLVSVAFKFDTRHVNPSAKWQDEQLYDIAATVPGNKQLTLDQMRPLLRDLLEQRFHLKTHPEEHLEPGYELVVGKSGQKLHASAANGNTGAYIHANRLWARNVDLRMLTSMLERPTGSPVADKTNLNGNYDFDLHFRPGEDMNSNLPDIFTAVQEQLGLKLVPAKVPVQYLVIDHMDREPTEN